MKKKLFSILCCSAGILCYAQGGKSIPGYLGSRNAVSVKIMPNLHASEEFLNQLFTPNFGLTYERPISRRGSISVSAGYSKGFLSSFGYSKFRAGKNNDLFVIVDTVPQQVVELEGYLRYRHNFFSIAKSYYNLKSGSIAPQGKFLKLGLTFNSFKIIKDSLTYKVENGEKYTNPGKSYKNMTLTSFNLEFGSKRFFSKHLFFQKSISLNIPFNFWSAGSSRVYNNIEDFNETHLAFFVSRAQTFNFSLAIGAAF